MDEDITIAGEDWTAAEIDLIVADYFDMFSEVKVGNKVNKAARNRKLQQLIGRGRGAIEFKHLNISAVLFNLGYPWLIGYRPRFNLQNALVFGVERYIVQHGLFQFDMQLSPPKYLSAKLPITFDVAPTRFAPRKEQSSAMRMLVQKFDPAERDAKNRELGFRGEESVLSNETEKLREIGRADLAQQVRWVSQVDGDGAGFDILSFSPDGKERLLEVKTTVGHKDTPFFISANEKAVADRFREKYELVRLYNFGDQTRAFTLLPPFENWVTLSPIAYRATFSLPEQRNGSLR